MWIKCRNFKKNIFSKNLFSPLILCNNLKSFSFSWYRRMCSSNNMATSYIAKYPKMYKIANYVVHNSESVAILSFKSSSSRLSEFVQPKPLQLPHAGEHMHFTLCFLHVHLILLHSVWQLHLTIFRSSSGAGGKSVSTGICFPSLFFHPHSSGCNSALQPFHSCIWKYTQGLHYKK